MSAGAGSAQVVVPAGLPPGLYRVQVAISNGNNDNGDSNGNSNSNSNNDNDNTIASDFSLSFSVVAPARVGSVVSPGALSVWARGLTYRVAWTLLGGSSGSGGSGGGGGGGSSDSETVTLRLVPPPSLSSRGVPALTIAAGVAARQLSFDWKVPGTIPTGLGYTISIDLDGAAAGSPGKSLSL